jgi:predicted Zn-ribbon and HTH transcriptional regulator
MVTRTCRNCGCEFEQGDKPVLNCAACRLMWRENRRALTNGPKVQLIRALEHIAKTTTDASTRAFARDTLRRFE